MESQPTVLFIDALHVEKELRHCDETVGIEAGKRTSMKEGTDAMLSTAKH